MPALLACWKMGDSTGKLLDIYIVGPQINSSGVARKFTQVCPYDGAEITVIQRFQSGIEAADCGGLHRCLTSSHQCLTYA